MVYLSLPIDSVGYDIRYANKKALSEQNFPVYIQTPIKENPYICTFYPVRRISLVSPKLRHHWTRIID